MKILLDCTILPIKRFSLIRKATFYNLISKCRKRCPLGNFFGCMWQILDIFKNNKCILWHKLNNIKGENFRDRKKKRLSEYDSLLLWKSLYAVNCAKIRQENLGCYWTKPSLHKIRWHCTWFSFAEASMKTAFHSSAHLLPSSVLTTLKTCYWSY